MHLIFNYIIRVKVALELLSLGIGMVNHLLAPTASLIAYASMITV